MTTEVDAFREFCNLPDEDLKARRAHASQEIFAFVRKREERPSGLVLYFDETPEMRERLDSFVAGERVCCSGIDWAVGQEPGSLRLEINGVDPKSAAFASLGSTVFPAVEPVDRPIWPRLLASIGLGSLGAATVCCVLPLGIAAFVGATPLVLLDRPWVIAATAVGLGGFLWHWTGRRERARRDNALVSGCGC